MKKLIKFKLEGKMVFMAYDIDDAFRVLSEHFDKVANDEDDDNMCGETDIHIEPYE